jgi:glyoxalase family protein
VPKHVPGSGDVAAIGFAVPSVEALEWWATRFDSFGVEHGPIEEYSGRPTLSFVDLEGQRLQLVAGDRPEIAPRSVDGIPAEFAIRGFSIVTTVVHRLEPTARLLTETLGFARSGEYSLPDGRTVTVFSTGPGGPGAELHVITDPSLRRTSTGIGGVHHVAFRTPTDEEHRKWQKQLQSSGIGVTPVIDRFYFRALYFREPGGVLFEISTDGPGFATDEDLEHLGEHLALPPFLEPRRAEIEAALPPLDTARSPEPDLLGVLARQGNPDSVAPSQDNH